MTVSRRLLRWFLLPLLFMGSCMALIPAGVKIADPMTNRPLGRWDGARFPVVVMTGDAPRIAFMTKESDFLVPLAAGSSYLIPSGRDDAIEAHLNRQHANGAWVLRVERPSRHQQKIELYWMSDGYSGGAYEATATTVKPLYRKITGPGYGCVSIAVAMLINTALWSLVVLVGWVIRRQRATG